MSTVNKFIEDLERSLFERHQKCFVLNFLVNHTRECFGRFRMEKLPTNGLSQINFVYKLGGLFDGNFGRSSEHFGLYALHLRGHRELSAPGDLVGPAARSSARTCHQQKDAMPSVSNQKSGQTVKKLQQSTGQTGSPEQTLRSVVALSDLCTSAV